MLTLCVAEMMVAASYVSSLKRRARKKGARRGKAKTSPIDLGMISDESSSANPWVVLAPALASAMLMACSRTLWAYATIAEVYTLNTLLILFIFFLMLRWRRRKLANERRAGAEDDVDDVQGWRATLKARRDSLLYAAALLFGLALGVHHVTVALMLPALAWLVYRTEGLSFFKSRRLLYAALSACASLVAVYAYLPLAASRSPLINWGSATTLERIWWHITGRQYQVFVSFSPEVMGKQFVEFVQIAAREFGPRWLPIGLALAAAGFVFTFRRDRVIFWFLALIVAGDLAYTLNYEIAEDKDAYYLPVFIALAFAAAFGVRWLMLLGVSRQKLARRVYVWALPAVMVVTAAAFFANLPFNNRRHYLIARDYVENILSAVEPDGLLLTLDWQFYSPALYVREVEQHRRDVKVVDVNLLRRSWYFEYLKRAYPDLIERSRPQVDAFLEELNRWERDPEAFAKNAALAERIDSRFQEMIRSFVTRQAQAGGPVYVTSDVALDSGGQDAKLSEWLTKNYHLVPQGLVFQLTATRAFHELSPVHIETRGLADRTLRFEIDDVVNLKVLPVYKTMLVNRGRYLASFGQYEQAIEAFKQALALDPTLDIARQGLNDSVNKLNAPKTIRP
jgi:tetratricopeptide (TPR) repeat protein